MESTVMTTTIPTADYRKIPTGVQINAFGNRYWRVVECTSSEMSSSLLLHALNCGGELSLEQFGQWCDEWYRSPWMIGDREMLPSEMGAVLTFKADEQRKEAEEQALLAQALVIEEYAAQLDADELFWMTTLVPSSVFSFEDSEPFHEE